MAVMTYEQLVECVASGEIPWYWCVELEEGRKPKTTSFSFHRNRSRSGKVVNGKKTNKHKGDDLCTHLRVGEGGGDRGGRWGLPAGTPAISPCFGYVQGTRRWVRKTTKRRGNSGAVVRINIFSGPGPAKQVATGWRTILVHLSRSIVKKGDLVIPGQHVGYFDEESPSSCRHMHQEVHPYDDDDPQDPWLLNQHAKIYVRQTKPAGLLVGRVMAVMDVSHAALKRKIVRELEGK